MPRVVSCRKRITKQTLWYEIWVMLENEPTEVEVDPEKVYITTELITNLQNALDNGNVELGETDIADLLILCETAPNIACTGLVATNEPPPEGTPATSR